MEVPVYESSPRIKVSEDIDMLSSLYIYASLSYFFCSKPALAFPQRISCVNHN